jgi:hypothetical protein
MADAAQPPLLLELALATVRDPRANGGLLSVAVAALSTAAREGLPLPGETPTLLWERLVDCPGATWAGDAADVVGLLADERLVETIIGTVVAPDAGREVIHMGFSALADPAAAAKVTDAHLLQLAERVEGSAVVDLANVVLVVSDTRRVDDGVLDAIASRWTASPGPLGKMRRSRPPCPPWTAERGGRRGAARARSVATSSGRDGHPRGGVARPRRGARPRRTRPRARGHQGGHRRPADGPGGLGSGGVAKWLKRPPARRGDSKADQPSLANPALCRPPCPDPGAQPEHVAFDVEPVAVHRVPPRPELPCGVPTSKGHLGNPEDLGGGLDRDEPCAGRDAHKFDLSRP